MRRLDPWTIISLACVLGLVAACSTPSLSEDLEPVVFMAGYAPQANLPFVGAYLAEELGYFEEVGLDVTIEHSAGEHLQLVAAGEVDVTTQDAGVLLMRRSDPGIPLVSIGLIGQTGQQAFVALAGTGIDDPSDWTGRRVGFKGTPPPDLFAILDAVGLDESDVELINVGFDPRILVEGRVDVYPVFKANEPHTLRRWGHEVEIWEAADYGIPTLGLTFVTTESTVAGKPEILDSFMKAVLKGIEHARSNPAEAVNVVIEYMGGGGDADHQLFILQTELADSLSEVTRTFGVGWQTGEQWSSLAGYLSDYELLPANFDSEGAWTNRFLPDPS